MNKKIFPKKPARRPFTLKERFFYWFDNKMARGSLGFIRFLIIASVFLAMLVAALIILFRFNEVGEVASVFWNSMATLINAEMPTFGEGSPGYLVMNSIVAIGGLLFTSVLIGIITSAIEEKIERLKKGNSLVVEKNHIVVLGFSSGEYTLLNQLILASGEKPVCIVVADNAEREEMEGEIFNNIQLPKNIRVVCRTVDITDPVSIEKCSVETCKTIVVSPMDDMKALKTVLAVSVLLAKKGVPEKSVNAIISKEEYRFPPSLAESNHISTISTNSIIARMIAHSCTQTGLSGAFRELFNFEGAEFYLLEMNGIGGLTFLELALRLNSGVPVGMYRDGKAILNPGASCVLRDTDRILVFSEDRNAPRLEKSSPQFKWQRASVWTPSEDSTGTTILGYNEALPLILRELPENVVHANIVQENLSDEQAEELEMIAAERNMALTFFRDEKYSEKEMFALAQREEHFVILSDHEKDPEEADMEAIFTLVSLRDFRTRYGLNYNITIELQMEHNQRLVELGDHTDYLVSSSMSSLILAQLAENPELLEVFRELLSNEGNELYLMKAGALGFTGKHTVRELRAGAMEQGYILLGILDEDKNSQFVLSPGKEMTLGGEEQLIVIGED